MQSVIQSVFEDEEICFMITLYCGIVGPYLSVHENSVLGMVKAAVMTTGFVIGMAVGGVAGGRCGVWVGSKLLVAEGVKGAVAGAGIGGVTGAAAGFGIGSICQ